MTTFRPLLVALACAALVALAGCSDIGTDPMADDDGGDGGGPTVSFAADVQPIFTASCVGCHGRFGNGGLDLRDGQAWANLVGQASTSYDEDRVVTGSPGQSLLYLKMTGAGGVGNPMPPSGPLPTSQTDLVRTWIEEGAEDN